jgi:competence protein ComEA
MKKIFLFLVLFSANILATPVNINTADAQTIADALNGIGEKKAKAIIAYRKENGAFKTIESLTEVSGIGEKTVEKIKEDILLTDKVKQEVKKPATKAKK